MDQEMKAYLDEQFGRMAERDDKNFRQIESLREEIRRASRLIAEGVVSTFELQEAHRGEIQQGFRSVMESVALSDQRLENRVQGLEDQAERQRHDVFEALRKRFGSSRTGQETPSSLFDDPALAPYRPKERT